MREGENGRKGVWRWGKRESISTYRYTVTTRMTCIKMGSDESHFNVSLIVRDKVTRQCPQTTTFEEKVKSSQVKWFILETPVGVHERTSMKEHPVRHKIQMHTTKRNKRQQKQKQNRTHFQNKKQPETRERSLTKTKARGKNENRWVQQTYTLTYTDTRLHIHPPTDSPPPSHTHTHTLTHKIWERRVKVGFDRHTFYKP